jgi:hypothetical protein
VSTPKPIMGELVDDAPGLGALVADDALNQMFAGLWAAGVLDQTLPIEKTGPLAALLDDSARTLEVELSLPPTVTTDGTGFELALGDIIITAKDEAGFEVQKLALSIETALIAGPSSSNKLTLTTTTPIVFAQVLAQSPDVDNPLTDAELEGIVGGVWGVVGTMADDALAKLPMPTVAGISVAAPRVSGREGYVVLDAAIQ